MAMWYASNRTTAMCSLTDFVDPDTNVEVHGQRQLSSMELCLSRTFYVTCFGHDGLVFVSTVLDPLGLPTTYLPIYLVFYITMLLRTFH